MPRALLGVVSLFVPIALGGCQLLLDTNEAQDRIIVLGGGGGADAGAGDAASTGDAPGESQHVCPPQTFCEWFDTPSLARWTVTPSAGSVTPDPIDAFSLPYALFVHVLPGAPSFVGFADIARTQVTGGQPVNAASLEVQMKLASVPLGQLVSLLELDAHAGSTDYGASLDLRQDGTLSVVVMKDDTSAIVDEPLSVKLEEWHRYWFKIDAARAQFYWAVDGDTPKMRSLAVAAAPAVFDVSAGLVWVQQTVTSELSVRYDDLKASWAP